MASPSSAGPTHRTHNNLVFPLERRKLLLLALVRLDEGFEHLLDTGVVGLERWNNVLDCTLDEDAADQPEALALRV